MDIQKLMKSLLFKSIVIFIVNYYCLKFGEGVYAVSLQLTTMGLSSDGQMVAIFSKSAGDSTNHR